MGTRPPWKSQLSVSKSRLGFVPFGQQLVLWQSKCSCQIPKSFSFYQNCGAVRRRQGGKKILGLQQLGGMGTVLLDLWQALTSTHHPGKHCSWAAGTKARAKGLEAAQWLRRRRAAWQAAHSPRTRSCGWGHPSVFAWAASLQPFPPLQYCHMLLSVRPQKKEKK